MRLYYLWNNNDHPGTWMAGSSKPLHTVCYLPGLVLGSVLILSYEGGGKLPYFIGTVFCCCYEKKTWRTICKLVPKIVGTLAKERKKGEKTCLFLSIVCGA
jgi:hypothetical protein